MRDGAQVTPKELNPLNEISRALEATRRYNWIGDVYLKSGLPDAPDVAPKASDRYIARMTYR